MDNFRKSPRAKWINYDYGNFFVTVCTKNKAHFFGSIRDGECVLSKEGEILNFELENPEIHHKNIEVPIFVVMPNHFHAIVCCRDIACDVVPGSQRNPNPSQRANSDMARHVPTLARYMASLKSAVTRQIHNFNFNFGWQRRFHDHYIRGFEDGNKIAEYIEKNPGRWEEDCFYS